jgi:FMN reductase
VTIAVVVGNPRAASRTLTAATYVAHELSGREADLVVDLATVGGRLLDWQDAEVASLVEQVGAADVVVVACPTYKATYTGLLKLFLDRFSTEGLSGVAVPLMLGAGPAHALAAELTLRPVLAEIGGTTVRGHYVLDSRHHDPTAYTDWLAQVRPVVAALTKAGALA